MIIFPGLIGSIAASGKTVVTPPASPLILGTPSNTFISLNSFQTSGQSFISVTGTGTETLTVTNGDPMNFSVISSPTNGASVSGGNTITITVTYIGFVNPTSTSINVSLSGGSSTVIGVSYSS